MWIGSKKSAQLGQTLVKELLQRVELTIPEITHGSKTKIVSRSDPLDFLGREIVHLGSENSFVARVPTRQIDKIKARLVTDFSFEKRSKTGHSFQDTTVDLSKSISAYLGIYKDAYNYQQFENDMRGQARAVILSLFKDIFGAQTLNALLPDARKFLGIEILDDIEPNTELDV